MKKKVLIIVLCISILILPFASVSAATKARTLKELRAELQGLKNKKAATQQQKTQTKNEINSAKNSIVNKQNEIVDNQQKVIDATNEIAQLEVDIANGKQELSNLVQTYQVSSGDNVYLEYVFDATSYEDLVYRYAIMEQVLDAQNEKIESWNDKIKKDEELKIDLANREVELNGQISGLNRDIDKLGDKLDELDEMTMDINDEIQSTQDLINYYVTIGCSETEDLDKCVSVRGDTGWTRPLVKGKITSLFGYRTDPITGKAKSFHSGTDIGGNAEGTAVYAAANGTVGKIIYKASCGGNQVYVWHTINGKRYTTCYMHLLTINVALGNKVTPTTVVGTVGGGKGTRGWETCSTGAHLHLGIGTGWYGQTYTSYTTWRSNLLSAKDVMKLPNSWSSRY